jgi:hypothetical protein
MEQKATQAKKDSCPEKMKAFDRWYTAPIKP